MSEDSMNDKPPIGLGRRQIDTDLPMLELDLLRMERVQKELIASAEYIISRVQCYTVSGYFEELKENVDAWLADYTRLKEKKR